MVDHQKLKQWATGWVILGLSLTITSIVLDITTGDRFKVPNSHKLLPIASICLLMLGAFFLGVGLGIFKGLREKKANPIDYGNMRKNCFLTTSGILGGGAIFIGTLYEIGQSANCTAPLNIAIMAIGYFLLGLFIGISKGKKHSTHMPTEDQENRSHSVSLSTHYNRNTGRS